MKLRLLAFALVTAIFVSPLAVRAADDAGTITGSVHAATGAPVAGAQVTVSGPVTQKTATDASGAFTFSVPAGIYRLDVSKGGFLAVSETDLTVLASSSVPVQITLQQADLSSFKTIARVVTSARSSINTGAAAVSITGRQEFANLAAPQINDVVQRIPGAVVEHGSSSPNTSLSLAGSQGYETQVLLDGHPLSAGRYGVWFSQFFSSYLVQNIETEIGPGNTTAFAGTAVGGTANIVTPGFTNVPTYEFATGFDNFSSQYSHVLDTGKNGKLSWVVGAGYDGDNSKFNYGEGCIIDPVNKSTWNTPGAKGVIQWCGNLGGPQWSKGELLKGRWDFSPSTSLELGYVGSQGGYNPQASAYGVSTGPITIEQCYNATHCTNPNQSGYIGQTINGYFFYPGSKVFNNQPLFTAQLRTAVGSNTLLIRPYGGSIARIIDGSGESAYPNNWYPSSNTTACKPAQQGPSMNGYTACNNTTFSVLESDKLKGGTLSFIHPMGNNEITGTYDYHSDETYAYYNDPSNVAVPDTTARFHTLSLTGDFGLTSQLTLKAGAYETIWNLAGTQTGPFVTNPSTGKVTATTVPLKRTVARFDPHVALTFQPSYGTSLRLAAGTSTTFPYASQVSGLSVYTPPSGTGGATGSLSQKNATLQPEHATEFDLGVDKRLHDGTIVSLDLVNTQISNVFETLSSVPDPLPTPPAPPYGVVYQPVNAAKLSSQMAMLTIRKSPAQGLGYYLSATAARSIPTGIPIQSKGFVVPANDIQQCSDGGSAVCIPYLKGYGSLSYTTNDGTFFKLGVDYEGKNNTYFQPPFAIWDLTLRRPVSKEFEVQLSTYNLLNTNTFSGMVTPNAGVPMTGENASGQYGNYAAGLPYPLIPVQPRTVRLQFRYHVGRE